MPIQNNKAYICIRPTRQQTPPVTPRSRLRLYIYIFCISLLVQLPSSVGTKTYKQTPIRTVQYIQYTTDALRMSPVKEFALLCLENPLLGACPQQTRYLAHSKSWSHMPTVYLPTQYITLLSPSLAYLQLIIQSHLRAL